MPTNDLLDKQAYFKQQELLDISDNESELLNEGLYNATRVFANFEAMPPPAPSAKLFRQPSSFLGPTPKELRQKATDKVEVSEPATSRRIDPGLTRSATAPESETKEKPKQRPLSSHEKSRGKLRKTTSMPELNIIQKAPFYKRMGAVPRELKNGKNVKLADNVRLDPDDKQLLKDKIVYFFPNDDISMARRRRLHKVIQLGAAWAKEWRDDVTYVIVDDDNHTYSQLLRNLNKAGLPVGLPIYPVVLRLTTSSGRLL